MTEEELKAIQYRLDRTDGCVPTGMGAHKACVYDRRALIAEVRRLQQQQAREIAEGEMVVRLKPHAREGEDAVETLERIIDQWGSSWTP